MSQRHNHPYSGISTIKAFGILLQRYAGYFLKAMIQSIQLFFKSTFKTSKKLMLILMSVLILHSLAHGSTKIHAAGPNGATYSLMTNIQAFKATGTPKHWNNPDNTSGIHWGGLLLGLFLPVIGVFLARHKKNKAMANRKKWAIIGSAIALGLIAIALISKKTKF